MPGGVGSEFVNVSGWTVTKGSGLSITSLKQLIRGSGKLRLGTNVAAEAEVGGA